MNMFGKNEKGFTLVELLIVVAIIGILAAIAIPQFTKYKRNAAISKAEASIVTCASSLSAAYAVNSDDDERNCTIGDSGTVEDDECTLEIDVNATMVVADCIDVFPISGFDVNCTLEIVNESLQVTCGIN